MAATRRTKEASSPGLSRREREVMDIVYWLGQATAAEIRAQMAQPPTDAAVRTTLRILVPSRRRRWLVGAAEPRAAARQSRAVQPRGRRFSYARQDHGGSGRA